MECFERNKIFSGASLIAIVIFETNEFFLLFVNIFYLYSYECHTWNNRSLNINSVFVQCKYFYTYCLICILKKEIYYM